MPNNPAFRNIYNELHEAPEQLAVPTSALAIGAHPDDIEFGAAGTLAKWASAGCRVTMLIVTDGSKGTWDPAIDPTELAQQRATEQAAAAALLGADDVRHLDYVDGELEYTMALREVMCSQIRQVRPEVVISHDPWRRYQLHPDHRATGWAVMDGVVAARDHLFFPDQGLEAHRPKAVLLWSADEADHFENISAHFDTKIEALLCHSSQGTTTMGGAELTADKRDAFVARMRRWAEEQGRPAGLELAESFKRISP
jgi:LmbE family N-acetylglucosaminyl deacetylase